MRRVATPGQLVDVVAEATGIARQTVSDHDRKLAEAGLRKSGGRGRNAAKMGPEDATALLLALLSGKGGAETVPAVRRLWALEPHPDNLPVYSTSFDQSAMRGALVPTSAKNLGDTLAGLLDTAARGQLVPTMEASSATGKYLLYVLHMSGSGVVDVALFIDDRGEIVRFGRRQQELPNGFTEAREIRTSVLEAVGAALADRQVGI